MTKEQGITVASLSWNPLRDNSPVLNDISCRIERGCFYGIIGPNGSGKTSFVRNLLRLIEAEEGSIVLDGLPLMRYKRKELAKKIALVPQNTMLESSFKVFDIVMMGRIPHQKRFADANEADLNIVNKAMQLTDCYHLKDKSVATLSGGEAQRVVTARAIAQDTPWLVLDEPTSNLDIKHQIELMASLVQRREKRENTVIAILHDINIAAAYCNRIIMMKNGQIHSNGRTEEVLTRENLRAVYEVDFDILDHPRTGKKYYVPYQN